MSHYLTNKVASYLRGIVATIGIYNLKGYLTQSVSVLPGDSTLKSIIVKEIIDNKNLTNNSLKATYAKLKETIKSYDVQDRGPFQETILKPIQAFFDTTTFFNPVKMREVIDEKKQVLRKSEKELKESKDVIKDVSKIPFPKVLD